MTNLSEFERKLNLNEGRLCLDFTNTVSWHGGEHPEEKLHNYGETLAWAAAKGLMGGAEARRVGAAAAQRPDEAQAVYARAMALRDAIHHIFGEASHGHAPEPEDLAALN